MKEHARLSMLQQLSKVGKEQGIDLQLECLPDRELKELYLKLQYVRSGCNIGISKGETIQEALQEESLMRLSFRDYARYGVRKITFKEYLLLESFIKENPGSYQGFSDLLYR